MVFFSVQHIYNHFKMDFKIGLLFYYCSFVAKIILSLKNYYFWQSNRPRPVYACVFTYITGTPMTNKKGTPSNYAIQPHSNANTSATVRGHHSDTQQRPSNNRNQSQKRAAAQPNTSKIHNERTTQNPVRTSEDIHPPFPHNDIPTRKDTQSQWIPYDPILQSMPQPGWVIPQPNLGWQSLNSRLMLHGDRTPMTSMPHYPYQSIPCNTIIPYRPRPYAYEPLRYPFYNPY